MGYQLQFFAISVTTLNIVRAKHLSFSYQSCQILVYYVRFNLELSITFSLRNLKLMKRSPVDIRYGCHILRESNCNLQPKLSIFAIGYAHSFMLLKFILTRLLKMNQRSSILLSHQIKVS